MAESLAIMKSLWATGEATFEGEYYRITGAVGLPQPVQRPHPPIIIGGGGQRVLGIAAREADIVGVNPSLAAGYIGPEVLETTTADYYHQRIEWIRQAAGDRFDALELQCLTFLVQIVPNRDEAVGRAGGDDVRHPEQVDGSPIALIGTIEQIVETLRAAAGALRVQLHRGPRGGDGGVRPGGGRARRHLGVAARPPRIGHLRRHLRPHPHRATWRWPRRSSGRWGSTGCCWWWPTALAEGGGAAGHAGRGPLRHGRRRHWWAGPGSRPPGSRSTGAGRPTPSTPSVSSAEPIRGPSCSSWWARTSWPASRPGRTSRTCVDEATLAVVGRPGAAAGRAPAGVAGGRRRGRAPGRLQHRAPATGSRPGSRSTGWSPRP